MTASILTHAQKKQNTIGGNQMKRTVTVIENVYFFKFNIFGNILNRTGIEINTNI